MKKKHSSHRYNINRPRPRHGLINTNNIKCAPV